MPVENLGIPIGWVHLFPIPGRYYRQVDRAEILLDLHHRGGYRTHVRDIRGEGKHVFASNVLQLLLPSPRDRDCRATECEFARHRCANTTRSSDDPGDLAVQ